ncbi:tubulin epsilon and delta complex protein 2-like [Branchiostoma lanceolatum]|uniref:tubulin epsilon and delta complex protein 2-like n=1 Tax=Branchiostoma lanceolatum TaxID=7740 RepID=UPI003454C1C5
MADLQSEFSELIELLEKVHNSCEKKRKEIELSCQDYREILGPWPDEASPTKQGELRKQEGEVPKGEGAAGDIPEREIQELKLLDNVLAKAQKVRKRHDREVGENYHHDEDTIKEAMDETSNHRYDEEHFKVKDEEKRPESVRVNQAQAHVGTSRGQRTTGNEQVASISKTKLNKLINMSGSAKPPSVSVKQPPKSSRPPGGVKKSYKLQAPFKTESERHKVPSRSQRQTLRPTSASNRTSQISQTRSLSTRPKVTSASRNVLESKKRTVTQPSSQHKNTNNVASSSVTKHTTATSEHLSSEMERELERNPTNQQSADIAKWLEDVKLSGIGEGDQVTAAEHKEEQETEKKRFVLKEDASKLVIPGKWKKLCAQNLKLRQKVQEMQLKQEQSAHKQHFVDRLESKFINNEENSDVEIPYKLMDIQRKKVRLLEMVEEVNIQTLSQESSWQDTCHAKVLLEFVHSQFRELISDVSQIENSSKNAVRSGKQVQLPTVTSAEGMSDKASSIAVNSDMWLPDELVHRKCLEMSYSPATPEVMVYNDPKDLKRIIALQHEAQILQLQIHIQKLVGEKILPPLQAMDSKNPQFLSLYRTVYSILTTGGERFPTLVRDV